MSYPPAVYHADTGIVSADLRLAATDPEVRYPNGGAVGYLATGGSTNGQFGLYHWQMTGAKSGPGPHFHRTFSESFYVLTGTIRIFDGKDWADRRPGDFIIFPEGGIHGFRNESGEPTSMLILFAPGAPREEYFESLARATEGQMSEDEKAEFYTSHDLYWA